MVLNTDQHVDSSSDNDNDNIVNTGDKIPIKYIMTMCDQLIAGLKQCPCIIEQENAALHSNRNCLDRNLLMNQMTLQEVFNKVICHNAASSPENPVPGPSSDVQIQPDDGSTDAPTFLRSSSSQM
jgi:hypothetical protein